VEHGQGWVLGDVWSGQRWGVVALAAKFERQKDKNTRNKDGKQQHDLALDGLLLVTRGYLEFLVGFLYITRHVLDVVIDAIKHTALVDDHSLQFLENVGKLDNALGDIFDFALALGDEGFVGVVAQALLLGLEECGL
jgi:hypothetical protein